MPAWHLNSLDRHFEVGGAPPARMADENENVRKPVVRVDGVQLGSGLPDVSRKIVGSGVATALNTEFAGPKITGEVEHPIIPRRL
jgi:hypothetical protein